MVDHDNFLKCYFPCSAIEHIADFLVLIVLVIESLLESNNDSYCRKKLFSFNNVVMFCSNSATLCTTGIYKDDTSS